MSEENKSGSGVDLAEVRRIAELANLELSPAEESSLQKDLNSILGHVAQLNELDTSAVAPMTQVSEVLGARTDVAGLRADVLRPCLKREPVMEEAPETDGVFFKVPKVIER